ncbi:MAG: aconitase X swivel domain-containing protein [Gemmatimonadales bacterium]
MSAGTEVLVAGQAEGRLLVLAEPLSFWGGVHEATGVITDTHHPQHGLPIAGTVLVMPSGRGSSSSSSVLAELIRAGAGPAAIVLGERDPIIALGALVAEALYRKTVPIVVLAGNEYQDLAERRGVLRVSATSGEVSIVPA